MNVDIFIPCFVDQVYPQTAFNMVKILERLNISVRYPLTQTCCGQAAFNNGFWDESFKIAEKFIREFSSGNFVVTPSASCAAMVRNNYVELFYNTAHHNEVKKLQKNIYEFSDFLFSVLKNPNLDISIDAKVTIHDSCSALREYKLYEQHRAVLKNIKGVALIEMKESDVCCGFGGTFSLKNESIAVAMAEHKVQNALETGAEYLILTEASCLMHIDGYIKKNTIPIRAMHIVDFLAQAF